jgi:hypothetical protein
MGLESRTAQQLAGELAQSAHGVVAREELLRAGLSDKQIQRRLESGVLIVEYRGVYRVGHRALRRE